MLRYIYAQPISAVFLTIGILLLEWTLLSLKFSGRGWQRLNRLLAAAAAGAILYITIWSRRPGEYGISLVPFITFAQARQQPELYRTMLMNLLLFLPLGMTLSWGLPRRWGLGKRIVVTLIVGVALSAGVEYGQYRFHLGVAEADDLLCNSAGTLTGTMSLLLARLCEKHAGKAESTPIIN